MIDINSNYIIASLGIEFSILVDVINNGEVLDHSTPPFELRDVTMELSSNFGEDDIAKIVSIVKRLEGKSILDPSQTLEALFNSFGDLRSLFTQDELNNIDDFVQELLPINVIAIGSDSRLYATDSVNSKWFENYGRS